MNELNDIVSRLRKKQVEELLRRIDEQTLWPLWGLVSPERRDCKDDDFAFTFRVTMSSAPCMLDPRAYVRIEPPTLEESLDVLWDMLKYGLFPRRLTHVISPEITPPDV